MISESAKQVVLYVSLDTTFRFFKICNKSENEGKVILSYSFSLGSCVCVSVLERQAPLGTMPPPSDIVKVAIEWPGANAQLLEIDQVSSGSEESGSAGQEASFRVGTTGRPLASEVGVSQGLSPALKGWSPLLARGFLFEKSSQRSLCSGAKLTLPGRPSHQDPGSSRMWQLVKDLSPHPHHPPLFQKRPLASIIKEVCDG